MEKADARAGEDQQRTNPAWRGLVLRRGLIELGLADHQFQDDQKKPCEDESQHRRYQERHEYFIDFAPVDAFAKNVALGKQRIGQSDAHD
jgi:hypothetical protein